MENYVTAFEEKDVQEGTRRVLAWAGVDKPYPVALAENITAGGGLVVVLYFGGFYEQWPAFYAGLIFAGSLCMFRFTIDELVAVIGITVACVTATYARIRNHTDTEVYINDARELARGCHELEKQVAMLQSRLARQSGVKTKPKPPPQTVTVPQPVQWADPYEGSVAALVEPEQPATIDQETLGDTERAMRLLNHYDATRKLSKHSAYEAGISHQDWKMAIQFLIACGAVTKSGNAYSLAVPETSQADALIDSFVGGRAKKQARNSGFVAP